MPPAAGQPFGKYDLVERIAAGGMAEIYRAHYRAVAGITKQVVIKKILPHYAGNKSFVRMFMDEAKIVVGLSHGNIAQVFDFGEIDGEFYLAMEFVHGQALSRVIRRARERQIPVIPTPFAVYLAMEMCKGLHYAHTALGPDGRPLNIVHRDVSPQNVILAYDGQVKLVDFGIAKARTAGRTETEAGAIKGKYVYFAPEQARGRDIDARTDVFATGTVLYEMLCGRLPFEGKMMDVLARVVRCDFPRPRSVNPDITPALERILLTAMAGDKAQRYPTAQALQEALAGYLYANAPTFSGASLQLLLGYLFDTELEALGTPVKLPRDFLEQVPLWQRPLPGGAPAQGSGEREKVTTAGRSSRRTRRPASDVPTRTADAVDLQVEPADTREKMRAADLLLGRARWLWAAAPLGAAALAAGLVLLFGGSGSFEVQVTSQPPGAAVQVDGSATLGVTPLLISGLSAERAHEVRLSFLGMKPWAKTVLPKEGETVPVHAQLEPEPRKLDLTRPLQPPPEPDEAQPPPPEPEPRVQYTARYPQGSLEVSARHHAFRVAPTRAARVRLDPDKTYSVWAEGKMSLGGLVDVLHVDQAFFYLEGDAELAPEDAFGLLYQGRRRARTLRHASALYVFLLDEIPHDNSGALKIRIQQKGSRKVSTLLVDARLHCAYPKETERLTLKGLDRASAYDVVVKESPKALSFGEAREQVRTPRVAYTQNAGYLFMMQRPVNDFVQVLEAGRTYRMIGAHEMSFFFVDDPPDDNRGALTVEVTPVVGSGGLFGSRIDP